MSVGYTCTCLYIMYAAFYASSSVVESVRKAQEENSALILSRALQMCRDKMVYVHESLHPYVYVNVMTILGIETMESSMLLNR